MDREEPVSEEDAPVGPVPLSVELLHDCRHLAASLLSTWGRRLEQEEALQRVWPLPGLVASRGSLLEAAGHGDKGKRRRAGRAQETPRAVAAAPGRSSSGGGSAGSEGDGDEGVESEDEARWESWLSFLKRQGQWEAKTLAPRSARQTRWGSDHSRAEGSEEEQQEGAEEGRLLPRVIAALQTAEGLGWEDAADEAEVQAIVAARLAWEEGSATPLGRPSEAAEGEGPKEEGLAEDVRRALTGIGLAMAEQPRRPDRTDGQRRRRLQRIRQSALAQATNRLELAVAAGVEYEDTRQRLQRAQQAKQRAERQQQQQQQQGVGAQPEQPGAQPAQPRPLAGAVPAGRPMAGGAAARPAGAQQQQQQQQWSEGEEEEEGGSDGGQPLGFAEVVQRLRGILRSSGVLEGCDAGVADQLVEPLLWLPGRPWGRRSLARLERALRDTELLASVGQELRQAEARQRDWAPRRQRRPLRPPLAAGAQLELLRARLLPAVIAGLEEGGGERGGLRPAGAADGGREPLQLGTQHSVVGRAWAAASSQEEAGEGQAGSGPAQELHTGASGAAAERGAEEEEDAEREGRLATATEAGVAVLWRTLDWALRCSSGIAALDRVEYEGVDWRTLRSRRRRATAAAIERPALPPQPLLASRQAAASLLDAPQPSSQLPAREGLAPATAQWLQAAAASGTVELNFQGRVPGSTEQEASGAGERKPALPAVVATFRAADQAAAAAGGGAAADIASLEREQGAAEGRSGGGGEAFGEPAQIWQQPSTAFYPPRHPVRSSREPPPAEPHAVTAPVPPAILGSLTAALPRLGAMPAEPGTDQQQEQQEQHPSEAVMSLWVQPKGKRRYSARNQPLVLLPRRWRPKVMKRRRSLAQVEAAGQQQYEQQTEGEGEEGQEKPGDGGQAQQGQQQQQAEQQQEAARPLAGVAGLRSATSAFQPLGTAAAQPGPGSQPNAGSAGQPPVQQGHPGAQPGGPSLASLQAQLVELTVDVRIAFESGLVMGLRPEVVARALARYQAITDPPD